MRLSKHNIISKISGSDDYFIINLLSQQADIIDAELYQQLQSNDFQNAEVLKQKGYLVDQAEEDKIYRKRYLEFIDNRDSDEVQLFFIPSYACNFACSYCYQDEYDTDSVKLNESVIDAFFRFVDQNFAGRKKYITLFGGEPLMESAFNRSIIEKFISETNKRQLEIAIVTNGYMLSAFIPLLKTAKIRELQVTLDGTAKIHNLRRPLKNGKPTFDHIVEGIDAALKENIPINLRMVVDKQNITELPDLAQFAIDRKWTTNALFKTQLGRNYELHHCQRNNEKLYSRLEMYKDIYAMLKEYPEILEFHRPAFSISKFLFEEGRLPDPLFDSCPGTKTEWAFDYTGKVYSCTATVGKSGEELGTFYPEIDLNNELIEEWQNRDVLAIPECKNCVVQLACGGGCASVAKNTAGKIYSPDCRPVRELLELGISAYQSQE